VQDVGGDLACSACTLSAHPIEREVLPLQKKKSTIPKRLAKALSKQHYDQNNQT